MPTPPASVVATGKRVKALQGLVPDFLHSAAKAGIIITVKPNKPPTSSSNLTAAPNGARSAPEAKSAIVPLADAHTDRINRSRVTSSRFEGMTTRMTLAENIRMIRAAIRAARKEGVPEVEVTFGDGATVRIPLAPEKTLAETEEVVL